MILRHYEVTCDFCGTADHYQGNVKVTISQARDNGWIITGAGEAFCCRECYDGEES